MRRTRLLPILAVLLLMACDAKHILGTAVDDTPANQAIVDVIQEYRKALERKDIDGILEVVSRSYFSNSGTSSNSDDYGYEQLKHDKLEPLINGIKSVSYTIYVKKIHWPKEGVAWADVEQSYKYSFIKQGKDIWKTNNNSDRFEFALEDGVWRITSGL